jgi:hypothetical protein
VRAARAFGGPFATVALEYSIDPADDRGVSGHRFDASAGAGYELAIVPRLSFDVRGELAIEQLTASIDDKASGRSDSQGRWVAAFSAGAEIVQFVAGPVALVAGAEAIVRTNRTDIQVAGRPFKVAPVADGLAFVGARVAVP